jgi:histone H3/H4
MADEEAQQAAIEKTEVEEEVSESEEQSLPFPNATVVRGMKKHIDSNKMIKKDVKVAMNKFLGEIVEDVSKRMNDFPYAMLDHRMFEDASRPYRMVKEMDLEKKRLDTHLDAIVQDCMSIKRDLESKFGEKEKL